MRTPRDPIYAGHRYPAEIISYAVWLYFRFPLSLRMVEEMLAARDISVTHETGRARSRASRSCLRTGGGQRDLSCGLQDRRHAIMDFGALASQKMVALPDRLDHRNSA
jgi:hypothetical protein